LRIGRIWVYKNGSDSGRRSDYILEGLGLWFRHKCSSERGV
jgi:hypothetical protein